MKTHTRNEREYTLDCAYLLQAIWIESGVFVYTYYIMMENVCLEKIVWKINRGKGEENFLVNAFTSTLPLCQTFYSTVMRNA